MKLRRSLVRKAFLLALLGLMPLVFCRKEQARRPGSPRQVRPTPTELPTRALPPGVRRLPTPRQ